MTDTIHYIVDNLRAIYGRPALRPNLSPLDVLIMGILSQATTNVNSDRTYESLRKRFGSWDQVRRARTSSIEAAIRSGGLASQKAVRIKQLLNEIHRQRGSVDLSFLCTASLEEATEFLGRLKGVGPATLACTLLFACGKPAFPVDTHILRIAKRLGLLATRCSDKEAHRVLGELIPRERYYEAHINLIRHGRQLCRPKHPLCEKCCLVEYCEYYVTG